MASRSTNGALSPVYGVPGPSSTRSNGSSPSRQRFPAEQLKPEIRKTLNRVMADVKWNTTDRTTMSRYSKTVSDEVKQKMMELVPQGFKYIITATISENLGQAGRADMSCHWEDTDAAIQEMFSNESIIVVVIAFAVRVI